MRLRLMGAGRSTMVRARRGDEMIAYEIINKEISSEAYAYLLRADNPITSAFTVTVLYDRTYVLHFYDLEVLNLTFGVKVREIK